MDPAWLGWLVLAIQRVPHVRRGPHNTHLTTRLFHFTLSYRGHGIALYQYKAPAPQWPSDVTWRSKMVHIVETRSRFTQWSSKPIHTLEIQASSHHGDPIRFTCWRSEAGSHNGDPSQFTHWRSNPSWFIHWRSEAGSHNRAPSQFTRWRSKPVHTMEIQADSHIGDPIQAGSYTGDPKPVHTIEPQASSHVGDQSRFTQWRSKIAHKSFMGIPFKIHGRGLLSSCVFDGRLARGQVGLVVVHFFFDVRPEQPRLRGFTATAP